MIKVADFGMSEDMYVRNYFRHGKSEGGSEEKVPIWWMAPESIEKDIYNERTDVVRYLAVITICMCVYCILKSYAVALFICMRHTLVYTRVFLVLQPSILYLHVCSSVVEHSA